MIGTRNSSGCWDYGGAAEQQSGVDLVNFLAGQEWSNGEVAMIGGSYDGTTASMVAARGQDAHGLTHAEPMPTGEPSPVTVTFKIQDWLVKRGHRMLVVASSNSAGGVRDAPGLRVEVASGLVLPVAPVGRSAAPPEGPSRQSARRLARCRNGPPDGTFVA